MRVASAHCNIVLWNNMQVIKYESVIHEFDPYFNYRVTQVCFPSSETFVFFFFLCCVGKHNVLKFLFDYLKTVHYYVELQVCSDCINKCHYFVII